jgi:hypothetical protein
MGKIDEFALKNIGLWWRYGISRHCDEWKYIIIGWIFKSEIILIPPSLKISESSSNGSYRNTDEVWWRYGISRSCNEWHLYVFVWSKNRADIHDGNEYKIPKWLVLKFHGSGHLQIILHLNKITECLKMTTFKIVFTFYVFF